MAILKAEFFVVDTNIKTNVSKNSKHLNDFLAKDGIKIKEVYYGFDTYDWNRRGIVIARHGIMIMFEDKK